MTSPAPPRRRWFRFSLRALFGVTTAIACWLGWEVHIVRHRQALIREMKADKEVVDLWFNDDHSLRVGGNFMGTEFRQPKPGCGISAFRRLLGDYETQYIMFRCPLTPDDRRAIDAFPEATIWAP